MGRDKIHGQSLLKDAIQSPNHQGGGGTCPTSRPVGLSDGTGVEVRQDLKDG